MEDVVFRKNTLLKNASKEEVLINIMQSCIDGFTLTSMNEDDENPDVNVLWYKKEEVL